MSINYQQKTIQTSIIILAFNAFSFLILLPIAQKSVNSHYGGADIIGTVYYIIAIFVLCWSVKTWLKSKNNILLFLYIILAISLFYWGYKLNSLYCLICANSG